MTTFAPDFINSLPAPTARAVTGSIRRQSTIASAIASVRSAAPEVPSDLASLATSDEVAYLEGRTRKTVERWARELRIPALKAGDKWVFPRPAIVLWDSLRSRQTDPARAIENFLEDVAGMFSEYPARMSVAQAARALRIEPRTFQDLCRDGLMPGAGKRGRDWYLDREALRARLLDAGAEWLDEQHLLRPTS